LDEVYHSDNSVHLRISFDKKEIKMYTHRFMSLLIAISLLAVVVLVAREANATTPFVPHFDSATRSYIAWGQAMQVRNAIDSGTRSYIAWGEALEAAGKLGDSGACSNTPQENIFAGIPDNVDSATRSYIAWGLALQARDDIRGLCR
jgi:hypothetical protein